MREDRETETETKTETERKKNRERERERKKNRCTLQHRLRKHRVCGGTPSDGVCLEPPWPLWLSMSTNKKQCA